MRLRTATLVALCVASLPATAAASPAWQSSWGTAVHTIGAATAEEASLNLYVRSTLPDLRAHDQTLRQIIRTSVGGDAVRVRLSNALGDGPLRIGHVTVAARGTGATVVPETVREVRFGGERAVTIAAGEELTSDGVDLAVGPEQELAISIHVLQSPARPTLHLLSMTASYASPSGAGDQAAQPAGTMFVQSYRHWFWLAGLEVSSAAETGTVVALGDSITDGAHVSNALIESKDESWPSRLAARLRTLSGDRYPRAVVNAGISANTVVAPLADWTGQPAVVRFDRDVLARPGVSHLIVYEGTNDLAANVSAGALADGLRGLAERARARGIKVIGATIAPRTDSAQASWTAAQEAQRQAVNAWIRGYRGWDGIVDVDRALQDPADPRRIRPEWDSGDGLHPNARGRQAIADAVDARLLRCDPQLPATTLRRAGISYRDGRVRVRGRSVPGRCDDEPLRGVTVSIARLEARGSCRHLGSHGRLGPSRRCSRATWLRARGTSRWRLDRRAALPAGRYRVTALASTTRRSERRGPRNSLIRPLRGAR